MLMKSPAIKTNFQNLQKLSSISGDFGQKECDENNQTTQFLAELHQEFLDGILVFSEQGDLIYANENADSILYRLCREQAELLSIPAEISHICHSLTRSRSQFPHQNWLVELDIVTQEGAILHIRARWLTTNLINCPCLLLLLEDRQQALANIVVEEAQQYGLTSREKEVWMLHRNDLTYKQIAVELGITAHTVKKHMKNIHSKKKYSALDMPEFSPSYAF